jgi:glyoxylate reductase
MYPNLVKPYLVAKRCNLWSENYHIVVMEKREEVYLTRRIPEPAFTMLASKYRVLVHLDNRPPTKQELKRNIRNKSGILCTLADRIDKDLLNNAGPNLKVISSYSTGYDHIDVVEATKRRIAVTTTGDILTETTADLTFGLILAISRKLIEADKYVRSGLWKERWNPSLLLGYDVCGSTLGILGLGKIGQAVAQRAKGFKMNIIYHSRHRIRKDLESRAGAKYVGMNQLLRSSDFLSIHASLNKDSFNLISKSEFRKMKKNAFLINTARGPIVKEADLTEALQKGWIAGAALDTYQQEPLKKSNRLVSLPNVVLLPHIGSATFDTRRNMSRVAAQNLINVLEGLPPLYPINIYRRSGNRNN